MVLPYRLEIGSALGSLDIHDAVACRSAVLCHIQAWCVISRPPPCSANGAVVVFLDFIFGVKDRIELVSVT